MSDFALMPSSPVSYTETQDEFFGVEIKQEYDHDLVCPTEDFFGVEIKQEYDNNLVCPADVFPSQVEQESTKSCLICHSFQVSPAPIVNEALLPDNFTITGQKDGMSEIIQDMMSSDIFSSFALSYELNQSVVFTSDDYNFHSVEQKIWPPKNYTHASMSKFLIVEKNQDYDMIKKEEEVAEVAEEKSLMVVIRLRSKKEFLQVLKQSGPGKEYKLPIFHTLQPLNVMKKSAKYRSSKVIPSHSEVLITSVGSRHHVIIKRYDSRLTLGQLALVLGLQKYKVNLVKDIETAVVAMFDQLCGFRIGHGTWCRGTPRRQRQDMISRVFDYAKIYFPSFTRDIIQIIIKRGAYSRTQEYLRRERRRKARYPF